MILAQAFADQPCLQWDLLNTLVGRGHLKIRFIALAKSLASQSAASQSRFSRGRRSPQQPRRNLPTADLRGGLALMNLRNFGTEVVRFSMAQRLETSE